MNEISFYAQAVPSQDYGAALAARVQAETDVYLGQLQFVPTVVDMTLAVTIREGTYAVHLTKDGQSWTFVGFKPWATYLEDQRNTSEE